MTFSDQSYNLRIELDTKNCELSASEVEQLERALNPLREPVKKFPVSNLYVTVEFYPRSHDYRVQTVLRLPGAGLATGDLNKACLPAFERCVRKLLHKVLAYEQDLERDEEHAKRVKGTQHDMTPNREVDINAVREAVAENDYAQFRRQLMMYEELLRKRSGRWIQRYPALEAQLDERFTLADIVEETYLNAFERFDDWSDAVPLGTWLEQLIDPSLRILSRDTFEELENISFARSLYESP